ncbi:hypothetical protein [uncultured Cohaesibacter sp.]|uniref:hypothetical protein n=1 Tax=uncultured Cohaesibacter sp. TaxID=1002546 RepID=UPI0029C9817F|nr:hypothetical protein [uncultured Cohaesibacter sp.]
MTDLFISMGHDISVKNLGSGSFRCRELASDEVAKVIAETRASGGEISGYYKFDSDLSDDCMKQFDELLLAFEAITGTRLTRNDFMSEPDEDGDQFPNLNYMTAVDETCRMLVVGYFFQFNPPSNMSSKAWKESFIVARDHMEFNLIEQVP